MKFNLLIVNLILSSVSSKLIDLFNNWLNKYNIKPSNHTFINWVANHNYIEEVNSKNLSYVLAHNIYSGYSSDEFSLLMGFNNERPLVSNERTFKSLNKYYEDIDWRDFNVVNSVKDQGQCGSCWAFSTIASLESIVAINTDILYNLSEQQLVDCDRKDHGCNGGLMDNAFTWIGKNNGVCTSESYPYVSGFTQKATTCNQSCKLVENTDIISYYDIIPNSDIEMMSALSQQPVSVAIEADQKDFQLYSSGVFTGNCGTKLDHGVALVGYGSLDNLDYYILRNSWGTSWGSSGYMYLGRGEQYNNGAGQCGVLMEGSYPVL